MSRSRPLVSHLFTADPSAHVFQGKLYIYPSHDIETAMPENDYGDHFDMRDYHVFSMDSIDGPVTDHGVALDLKEVPWAGRQMWAPDAAHKNGTYYLYFPLKDKENIFRIGVATASSPEGPFKALPQPIKGSFSIDPAIFEDDDGSHYLYFGGLWGGQLQFWQNGSYSSDISTPYANLPSNNQPALCPKVARMNSNLLEFDEKPKDLVILDKEGNPLKAGDNEKRFFEAAWMHKYKGTYYFSYSTGDTHYICYATGDNPYGPFTYRGIILTPVLGWTTHHSICPFKGKWYLFYHDCELSGGKTHLRNIKVTELFYREDGTIETIDGNL